MSYSHAHDPNSGCCNIPPVVEGDYTPKGTYKKYGELEKVYVTGPENTDRAIVFAYDIFGFYPQTLQGADLLAQALNAQVIMPDFFRGKPFDLDFYMSGTPEFKKSLGEFFKQQGDLSIRLPEAQHQAEQLRKDGKKHVGFFGLCWGGKMALKAGQQTTPFDAVATCHPAMLDLEDAEGLAVPLAMFPSEGEPADLATQMSEVANKKPFGSKNAFKIYSNQVHGYAGARAKFSEPEAKKAYEEVYGTLLPKFFEGVFNK